MKKLIFRKFNQDTLKFFLTSILITGLIVWTLQAVNYFDFVTKDGHGLKVYFFFTVLNFPKIIHRILPFVFFFSIFYTIKNYEIKNELSIFWINGITKISFANKLVGLSIILMFFQIFLGSFVSPKSQFKAREYLKNSNIDFFTSLMKEGKFINVAQGLTIFINKKNDDGTYTDIFLDDSRGSNSKMIFSKNGNLVDNDIQKIFNLQNGKVINNDKSKINIFGFDTIDFNLNNLNSNTITTPKIQEIDSIILLSCFSNFNTKIFTEFDYCSEKLSKDRKQELLKRFYKPIYIPVLTILCCFMIIYSKSNINYRKNSNIIFFIIFFLLIISEASLRYALSTSYSLFIYLIIPLLFFITAYLIFYRRAKYA